MKVSVIGVAGASGSGKTTVTNELFKHYGARNCTIISSDNYYKGLGDTPLDKRHEHNFDHPDSIDFRLLADHLKLLKANSPVDIPTYDFSLSARTRETKRIIPTSIIIVEGILVLHPQQLTLLFDAKVFVNADLDLCLKRRIQRDTELRGRKEEDVILQYENTVRPMCKQFVSPCKDEADFVIENSTDNHAMLEGLRLDIGPVIDFIDLSLDGQKPSEKQRYTLFSRTMGLVAPPSSVTTGLTL